MIADNYSYAYPHQGMGSESHSMVLFFGLSIFIHVVFLGVLILAPNYAPNRRLSPGVVNVRLVSLPGPGPAPAAKTVVQPKPAIQKPTPAPVPKPEPPVKKAAPIIKEAPKKEPEVKQPPETVSLAPAKPKTSLKKETFDRTKAIESAIDQVEQKVESSSQASVASAIEKIKKKVAANESADPERYQLTQGEESSGGPANAGGGGGGGDPQSLQIIEVYRIEVAYQIERNWAFSPQLAGGAKDLEARVVFKVLPNGEITDIQFTEKSDNEYLDDSVYRAVVKSNPVLPHPAGIGRPYITVGIRFTPEGVR